MLSSILLISSVLALNGVLAQEDVRKSHCPQVLAYDSIESNGTRYNANILIRTRTLNGFKLDLELDRAIQLLGNDVGEVNTTDNRHFTIITSHVIKPRPPFSLQVFVKYEPGVTPYITSIAVDGKTICDPESTNEAFEETSEESMSQSTTERSTSTTRPLYRVKTTETPTIDIKNDHFDLNTTTTTTTTTTLREERLDTDDRIDNNNIESTTSSSYKERNSDEPPIECGRIVIPDSVPLIVKGQPTTKGQWPWHVAVYKSDPKTGNLNYQCGGTLLSRKTIVTAAHCVTEGPFNRPINADTLRVFLGKYHLKEWSETGLQEKGIAQVIVHPTYNKSAGFVDDIAVLEFVSPVTYNTYVRPVCLWDRVNASIDQVVNQQGTVVGWGIDETAELSEELMMTTMPVVSYVTCIRSKPDHYARFLSNTTFCAGHRNGTSACNGDSGGGMLFPRKSRDGINTWFLRGLVSNSVSRLSERSRKRVCDPAFYVIFTDVAQYLDWIGPHIRD